MSGRSFLRLARAATLLTLVVVVMGAWVRLSDAGLGCPDWPGCYGQLTWPNQAEEVARANHAFPERPVETGKAWREMVHRYAAGLLGLLILALAAVAWRRRRVPGQPVILPLLLVALVIFQALLGMWTVTLKLKPLVVMAHLLGGLATLSGLFWLALGGRRRFSDNQAPPGLRRLAAAALAVVVVQIALGGWTSANYAALACPDFPQCQGQWWPRTDFSEAFVLWRGIGPDYEFGVLHGPARAAIQLSHRIGAVVTALVLLILAWRLFALGRGPWRGLGAGLVALLLIQVSLGVANVLMRLPLPVAVGHNAGAALLLLWLILVAHRTRPGPVIDSR